MNRENIQKVRDVIAAAPAKKFDMSQFIGTTDGKDAVGEPGIVIKQCNTVACVAGWAMVALDPHSLASPSDYDDIAGVAMGLDSETADKLFFPPDWLSEKYTRPHAVRVLDHLLATGEVDWKSTRRAKKAGAK